MEVNVKLSCEVIPDGDLGSLDPRAAAYPEDTALWRKVLTRAALVSDDLFWLLKGYRSNAARLVELKHGGFGLRPSPDWGGNWDTDKERYLVEREGKLREVLR